MEPTRGTYMYFGGSALILAVVAIVAANKGSIVVAVVFGVLALGAISYLVVRRRGSRSSADI